VQSGLAAAFGSLAGRRAADMIIARSHLFM
jgi:hypothetical protein